MREVHRVQVHVLQQASRRGDDHVGSPLQPAPLHVPGLRVVAAIHGHGREGQEVREAFHLLVYLLRQFAGGCHDDGLDARLVVPAPLQVVQQRQDEGGCFPRARLRAGYHVLALQQQGDGLFLHRGGIGKVHCPKSFQHFVAQI